MNGTSLGMAVVILGALASGAHAVETRPAPMLTVELDDGRLRLEARDQPLMRVVDELRRVTGVAVHVRVRTDRTVTASLSGVTLQAGLPRLFGAEANLVFSYAAAASEMPTELWVWPDRPEAVAADAGSRDSADAGGGETALPDPIALLHDLDPRARVRAVAAVAATRDDSLVEALARVARDDPERDVRAAAAEALAEIGSWRALAALKYVTQAHPRAFTTHNGAQP